MQAQSVRADDRVAQLDAGNEGGDRAAVGLLVGGVRRVRRVLAERHAREHIEVAVGGDEQLAPAHLRPDLHDCAVAEASETALAGRAPRDDAPAAHHARGLAHGDAVQQRAVRDEGVARDVHVA